MYIIKPKTRDRWNEILTDEYSVEPETAETIIQRITSYPEVRFARPTTAQELRETVETIEEVINSMELTEYGEIENTDILRMSLIGPLKKDLGLEPEPDGPDPASAGASEEGLGRGLASERGRESDSTLVDDEDADAVMVDLDEPREALEIDFEEANANQNTGILAADAGRAGADEEDVDEGEHETLDEIRKEHGQDETDPEDEPAVSKAQLRSILIDSLGVSECYTVALRDLIKSGDAKEVTGLLESAWAGRDQAETARERRDATAAGVLLRAHVELGLDMETSPNRDQLTKAVNQWADELPEIVVAVHEAITDRERTAESETSQASVDTDEFTRDDLEVLIFSQLVGQIEQSVTDVYISGLQSVLDNEAADAVRAFNYAWQNRSDAANENEHRDGIAAGVGLLAHVSLDVIDEDIIDETTIIEEVAINQQALSNAVVAVYEAAVGRTPSSSPQELRDNVGSQREDYGRDELETLVMAELLELLQNNSVGETYAAALYSIVEAEQDEAVKKLKQVWNNRGDTEGSDPIAGVAAGVALLAHAELGLESEVLDQETLAEEMETHRAELSDAVTAVYDACREQPVDHSPEELIQQAETEDPEIEDLEYIAFASLLSPFVDNDS